MSIVFVVLPNPCAGGLLYLYFESFFGCSAMVSEHVVNRQPLSMFNKFNIVTNLGGRNANFYLRRVR